MKEVLARLRPWLPWGTCSLAACCLAYLLTQPMDYVTAAMLLGMACFLLFPLLLRWHYPLLLVSVMMPVTMFFVKGNPPAWMVMMGVSLIISLGERAMSGVGRFVTISQIAQPLLLLGGIVLVTAELTGGLGFHSLGGEVFGGKKYAQIFAAIGLFYAVASRPIPPNRSTLYATLFLIGGLPGFLGDLAAVLPSGLSFIFHFINPGEAGMDELGNYTNLELGVSRMGGVAVTALAIYMCLLARYGIQGIFQIRKPWRWMGFLTLFMAFGLGGYRSTILLVLMILVVLFLLEGLHRTPMLLVLLLVCGLGGVMLVIFSQSLPLVIQRSLAFLPLNLNPEAVASAQGSSEWRLEMWASLLPEVPRHLLLGKGFAISAETYNEMTSVALSSGRMDASQQTLALASDFHNGPLSVVLPLGLWGCLAFTWFLSASLRILTRNYRYGDPSIRGINRFLLAFFIVKVIMFVLVFGDLSSDLFTYTSCIAFSLALNRGMSQPAVTDASVTLPQIIRFKRPLAEANPISSAHPS